MKKKSIEIPETLVKIKEQRSFSDETEIPRTRNCSIGRAPHPDMSQVSAILCLINHTPSSQSVAGKHKQNIHYSK